MFKVEASDQCKVLCTYNRIDVIQFGESLRVLVAKLIMFFLNE